MTTVYLAGPIKGLTLYGAVEWRDAFARQLPHVWCLSPLRGKQRLEDVGVITGCYEANPLTSARGVTCRDFWDVRRCDLVVANLLDAQSVSIGTVLELGAAHALNKPIVLIMEPDNLHEHPMLQEIAGFVVSSLEDAIDLVGDICDR